MGIELHVKIETLRHQLLVINNDRTLRGWSRCWILYEVRHFHTVDSVLFLYPIDQRNTSLFVCVHFNNWTEQEERRSFTRVHGFLYIQCFCHIVYCGSHST